LHDRAAAAEQVARIYAAYLNTQPLILF